MDLCQGSYGGPWHRSDSWCSFSKLRCCLFLDGRELRCTHRQYVYLQEERIKFQEYLNAPAMKELFDSAGVVCSYYAPDRRPNLDPNVTDTDTDTDSDSASDTDPDSDSVSEPEHRAHKRQLLSLWCTTAAKAKAKTMVQSKAKARRLT